MPYRVLPDGTILADTAEEALALSEMLRAQQLKLPPHLLPPPSLQHFPGPMPRDFPPREVRVHWWHDFLRSLNRNMLRVLAILHTHPDGISFEEMMEELGTTNPSVLSGVLSGITKNIGKSGLASHLVLVRETMGYGTGRVVRYRPGTILREQGVAMPP